MPKDKIKMAGGNGKKRKPKKKEVTGGNGKKRQRKDGMFV